MTALGTRQSALSPAVIALTPGEPAGIGPDLTALLAQDALSCALVLVADGDVLAQRARQLRREFSPRPWTGRRDVQPGVYLCSLSAPARAIAGQLKGANAAYVVRTLERATDGCLGGEFDALVTGPVQKSLINDAGIVFTGHTEFLAERARAAQPVMMLATPDLRVALVTTHLPLADVSRHLTPARLTRVLEIMDRDLRARFGFARPRIAVCGLNPHAGEGGHLGREEIEIIEPVLRQMNERGMSLTGPLPADTAFTPASLARCDAVLAMYHDQGLPVIKHHDFANAVNITLGLPFVRTSVDHGTALDLAGTGRADASSLRAALDMALTLAQKN
jgi:4-hydroxythreonine-4-phosphate dehydrogenase